MLKWMIGSIYNDDGDDDDGDEVMVCIVKR